MMVQKETKESTYGFHYKKPRVASLVFLVSKKLKNHIKLHKESSIRWKKETTSGFIVKALSAFITVTYSVKYCNELYRRMEALRGLFGAFNARLYLRIYLENS